MHNLVVSCLIVAYLSENLYAIVKMRVFELARSRKHLHTLWRPLHILARRNSAWGYGAGFSIAIVWNAMGLFITHLIQAGAIAFWLLQRTGHAEQLVPMTVALGGIGHFILIFSTILAASRRNAENRKWWKFAGGSALSVAYFALLVAFFKPH